SLPPRGTGPAGLTRPALRTQVVIEAHVTGDGRVAAAVSLGGSLLCQQQTPLPGEIVNVWSALRLPTLVAAERVAEAGRRLAGTLFDDAAQRALAAVTDRLPPGDSVEITLAAEEPLLW